MWRMWWQAFELAGSKPLDEYLEARALGIQTRPVLLGPVSFLLLSKPARGQDPRDFNPLSLLPGPARGVPEAPAAAGGGGGRVGANG